MADAPSQDAAPVGDTVDGGGGWLDTTWMVLPTEALPGLPGIGRAGERRFVLLHPARGMVILDLWSTAEMSAEEVAASLDAERTLAGFLCRFDPRVPVRRIHLAQAALPRLAEVVARSYAGAPPLELPETWIEAVRNTLAAAQTPTDQAWLKVRRRRTASRYRLAAGIAALVAVGAASLLAPHDRIEARQAQPVPAASEASVPQVASPAMLAVAVPEPGRTEPVVPPAARSEIAVAEPPPAPVAIAPPLVVADRATIRAEPLPDVAPAAAEALPTPPGPARSASANAEEDAADRPSAPPPRPAGRPARGVRRVAHTRFPQGWVPNSSGSFIQQQSQLYATGNGG